MYSHSSAIWSPDEWNTLYRRSGGGWNTKTMLGTYIVKCMDKTNRAITSSLQTVLQLMVMLYKLQRKQNWNRFDGVGKDHTTKDQRKSTFQDNVGVCACVGLSAGWLRGQAILTVKMTSHYQEQTTPKGMDTHTAPLGFVFFFSQWITKNRTERILYSSNLHSWEQQM